MSNTTSWDRNELNSLEDTIRCVSAVKVDTEVAINIANPVENAVS